MPVRRRAGLFGGPRVLWPRAARRRIGGKLTRGMVLAGLRKRGIRMALRTQPYAFAAYGSYRAARHMANKFSRRNIGEYIGTNTGKLHQTEFSDLTNQATRTLYSFPLCNIPKGDEMNQRERSMLNLRGFKICMEWKNDLQEPLYINLCVLCPKAANDTQAIPGPNFFRNQDNNDSRGTDFTNALNSNEFHCLPINTDLYTVLRHKRYRLIPGSQSDPTTNSASGLSYMRTDWWVPVKRQLRFDTPNSAPTDGQCFLVYWADEFGATGGSPPVTNAMKVSKRTITYFREPKN